MRSCWHLKSPIHNTLIRRSIKTNQQIIFTRSTPFITKRVFTQTGHRNSVRSCQSKKEIKAPKRSKRKVFFYQITSSQLFRVAWVKYIHDMTNHAIRHASLLIRCNWKCHFLRLHFITTRVVKANIICNVTAAQCAAAIPGSPSL